MQFLNPGILWALGLISIPILIHLFNFQRLKKISFTNVRWLEEIKTTSSKSRNLKHLLVLLARILSISMVVLAFSQPVLPPAVHKADPGNWDRVFYLDNSFSMEVAGEGADGLSTGRNIMGEIIDKTNFSGDYFFFDNSFSSADEYPYERSSLLDRFSDLDYSLHFRKGNEVVRKANSFPPTSRRKEVWMFSDFQENTFGDLEEWAMDSLNEYFLYPLSTTTKANFYVDTVWLSKPFIEVGNSFELRGILKASGDFSGLEASLRLIVDGNQRASKTIIFEDRLQEEFVFELSLENPKDFNCTIEINDEGISSDNHFRFILTPLSDIRVSEIGVRPNPYLAALFHSEPAFDLTFMPYGNPDLSVLERTDLLIVHDGLDYQDLPNGFLQEFLESGGHVMLLPEGDSSSLALRSFMRSNGLSSSRVKSDQDIKIAPLSEGDPFFEGVFDEFDRRMDLPYIQLTRDLEGWDRSILNLRNEKPLLAYANVGQGRLYMMGSPLLPEYGNFVKHSIFVPVFFRLAAFSTSSEDQALFQRYNREFLKVKISVLPDDQLFRLSGEGMEIIPNQRIVGKYALLSTEGRPLKPGFFNLVLNDTVCGSIAINTASRESEISVIDYSKLKAFSESRDNVRFFEGGSGVQISKSYNMDFVGRPLWKYCLIFALVFLLAETLIIRFL